MKYQHFMLDSPNRLVMDIRGAEINSVLQGISSKALSNNPFIRSTRTGQNTPSTVRVVVDLEQSTHPQVFASTPVGNFRSRLIIDLYLHGADTNDPVMALLNDSVPKQRPNANTAHDTPAPKSSRGSGGNRYPVIMLDSGHDGEDPGAIGPSGLREKNVVLFTIRGTRKRLETLGYNMFMTRNGDIFIPLGIRVAGNRTYNTGVFAPIHADAFTSPSARGTGVYMLNTKGATSSTTKFLAQTQNNADATDGIQTSGNRSIDSTILDTTRTAILRDSRKPGHLVLTELGRLNQLHKGCVDEANFTVLRAPDIPSVLVETTFPPSPTEERSLDSESFRQQCTQAITPGIQEHINTAVLHRGQQFDEARAV